MLQRQNQTLEQMAATLFRQWFIEEAKEDWEITKLGEVVKITYGKNLPTSKLVDIGFPVFGGNGQIGFFEYYLYEDPQVLVSCRGEASGKVNISLPKSYVTNNSLVLEKINNLITFHYLKYYAINSDFKLYVSGSAQPQITIENLFGAPIQLPPEELIRKFTVVCKTIEDKRLTNTFQIKTLQSLRDTLLPKLISGEIRLKGFSEKVDGLQDAS